MVKTFKFLGVIIMLLLISSCSKSFTITYKIGDLTYEHEQNVFSKTENFSLPRPTSDKDGYLFDAWFENKDFSGKRHISTNSLPKKNITLYLKWKVDDRAIDGMLKPYSDTPLATSLNFVTNHKNFLVRYDSSNVDVLTNEGILKREYEQTNLTLKVTYIDKDDNSEYMKTYEIKVAGYKQLDDYIRSSYIYRTEGYQRINQNYLDSLDIVYAGFALADDFGIVGPEYAYYSNLEYLLPKAKENGVWVVMSVGPSSSWSSFSKTASLREVFANSVVEKINEFGFDGVDIDWETPTTAESNNYVSLMKIVYEKVKANNPTHLVTTAITAGPYQPPKFNLKSSIKYIDYINLMAYDLNSSDGMYQNALYDRGGFHDLTNLVGATQRDVSIDKTITILNSYGVPNSKIVVGVPFYGRKQIKVNNKWVSSGAIPYHDILQLIVLGNYSFYYDEVSQVPYLLKNDLSEFISYDNPQSILAKGTYVINNNLAGMMYWEDSDDETGNLLKAINDVLRPK